MELSEIIRTDAVRAPIKATSKKRLLQDPPTSPKRSIGCRLRRLQGADGPRELGPTGIGRGVAIPHARFAGVGRVIGVFVRLEKPVGFESIDRQPVDLVFALLAPEEAGADHLKALARVSRTLRSDAICAKLRSTFDPSALYAILTDGKAEQPGRPLAPLPPAPV